jgi:hypothetical protein
VSLPKLKAKKKATSSPPRRADRGAIFKPAIVYKKRTKDNKKVTCGRILGNKRRTIDNEVFV